MPIYRYKCAEGHAFERFLSVRDHEEALPCEECPLAAIQVIGAPMLVTAAVDVCYDSPIDGRPITSHQQRREDMKRSDSVPYDPEMKRDALRRKQESQDQFESAVEQTVHEEIAKMPRAKKQQLIREVVREGQTVEQV